MAIDLMNTFIRQRMASHKCIQLIIQKTDSEVVILFFISRAKVLLTTFGMPFIKTKKSNFTSKKTQARTLYERSHIACTADR